MSGLMSHLHQDKLDSSNALKLLQDFKEWLCTAEFSKGEEADNFETCIDKGMDGACQKLIADLDLYKKVSLPDMRATV